MTEHTERPKAERWGLTQCPDGGWVLLKDYDQLLAEVVTLKAESDKCLRLLQESYFALREMTAKRDTAEEQIATLQQQIEGASKLLAVVRRRAERAELQSTGHEALDTPVDIADALERVRSLVKSEAGRIAYLDDALNALVVRARVTGHADGQAHAIADVNAGVVDDLIQPRLQALKGAAPQCYHGHTERKVGCVWCVLVFDRQAAAPQPPVDPPKETT